MRSGARTITETAITKPGRFAAMARRVCSERKSSFGFRHALFPTYSGAGPRRPMALTKKETKVMTAQGLHLFPFRTEKLNLATPMVLRKRESR